MKKMNGRTLEMEPGTIGYQQINVAGINKALNAWAKRRGIEWDGAVRRRIMFGLGKKKGAA